MNAPANDVLLWDLWEAARRAVEHHAVMRDKASKLLMDMALARFGEEFSR